MGSQASIETDLRLAQVAAFSSRCARRVQPLFRLSDGHPDESFCLSVFLPASD